MQLHAASILWNSFLADAWLLKDKKATLSFHWQSWVILPYGRHEEQFPLHTAFPSFSTRNNQAPLVFYYNACYRNGEMRGIVRMGTSLPWAYRYEQQCNPTRDPKEKVCKFEFGY